HGRRASRVWDASQGKHSGRAGCRTPAGEYSCVLPRFTARIRRPRTELRRGQPDGWPARPSRRCAAKGNSMIAWLLQKVLGTKHEREIKKISPRVNAINDLEARIKKLSDAELRAKTAEFRLKLSNAEKQGGAAAQT